MLIYGKNTVKEAIVAKRIVHMIYIDNKFTDKALLSLIEKHNIKQTNVSKHKLNELSNNGLHQGIVADVQDYQTYPLECLYGDTGKKVLILDKIEDPHNFGAILRTAEAVSMDGIIIPKKGQAGISPLVAKIASGALEYVKIIEVTNLYQTIVELKKNNYWIIGSTLDAKDNLKDIDKSLNLALIVGNEGIGMSQILKMNCDHLVKIPMTGKANSLNVSVAAALLMYQMKNLI